MAEFYLNDEQMEKFNSTHTCFLKLYFQLIFLWWELVSVKDIKYLLSAIVCRVSSVKTVLGMC